MIEQAEKRGDITKNTTIIESSSGNTAIAIAMVAAMKGYHFKPVVDVKMPQGKLDLLRIFGADVELVGDPTIPPDEQDMTQLKKDRRATVARLVEELGENAYSPNQVGDAPPHAREARGAPQRAHDAPWPELATRSRAARPRGTASACGARARMHAC